MRFKNNEKNINKILLVGLISTTLFSLPSCKNKLKHDDMKMGERIQIVSKTVNNFLNINHERKLIKEHRTYGAIIGYKICLNVSGSNDLYYYKMYITIAHDASIMDEEGIFNNYYFLKILFANLIKNY